MKPIIPVVAACITEKMALPGDLAFLLHKKNEAEDEEHVPRNPELVGKWEFSGGMVKYGEDPEAALRREIREELNREIIIGRLIHARTNIYKDGVHYLVLFYHCKFPEHLPPIDGCKWFSYSDIVCLDGDLAALPGTLEVVKLCIEHCRAWESCRNT